jgi:hypothetical protein
VNAFWAYFWPVFGIGLLSGVIAGLVGFRAPRVRSKATKDEVDIALGGWRRRRARSILVGAVVTISAACLWHGPLGGADRFAAQVERSARQTLDYWEMTKVTAHIQHGPLTRRVILAGPADDFQSSELVRIIGELPGVSRAQWSQKGSETPLILEGAAACVLGFLLGLVLAYLVELRRRYNAQWNW